MKSLSLIVGLIVGAIIGFGLAKIFTGNKSVVLNAHHEITVKKWQWPEKLDAVKAAPDNHHVLFENDQVRILEVLLRPYEFEKMHTHKFPSVMFGAETGDTSAFDIIYYRYGYDSVKRRYFVRDSIKQHNGGSDLNEPNTGNFMKPEGPHRIKNLSNVKIDVFRVEFKNLVNEKKSN